MLGLHDEALIQYDELDAMFTQFILNSQVGSKQINFVFYDQWHTLVEKG